MKKLFISYAHSDGTSIAEWLFKRLKGAGFQVWKDNHSLPLGSPFVSELSAAIENHDFVLVVLSGGAIESRWVEFEANLAATATKRIVPIVIDPVDVPLRYRMLHYLRMEGEDGMKLHELANHLGGGSVRRIVNLSGRNDFFVSNSLVLDDAPFKRADLASPTSIEDYGVELACLALPYIRNADAGIIPPGSAPVASVMLAYLLGEINQLPLMYVPWPNEDGKFQVDGSKSLNLQGVRHRGFSEREETR